MSDLDRLPPASRLWLFAFNADIPEALLARVRAFCASWTSHGRTVSAAADTFAGRVLGVAAQISESETNAGVSGCGIDAMQHAVGAAAEACGLSVLPALSVTYRDEADAWQTVARPAFRRLVREGAAGAETTVFDLTPTTLGALAGGPERRAGEAWHATAFQIPQTA